MTTRKFVLAHLVAAAFAAPPASAVYLSPDGIGQALIFPYYTVQSSGGNAFNTLVSIRNHTSDSKVVKLRFREGRNSQEVLAVDLYLSPNDMWTGALVPASSDAAAPARLVSNDLGCTDPPIPAGGLDFRNSVYAAAGDGAGVGLDRTREGFFEVFDMATVSGVSATAISRDANAIPVNCSAVQNTPPTGIGPPSGGLSGTETIINVANGMDFGLNAEALADLTKVQMYHARSDAPLLDFNSAEIDAVSHVAINGAYYKSLWSRPVDAVSAVLMRTSWLAEYVLDRGSLSRSNIVMTFPTKRHYVTTTGSIPPFTSRFAAQCSTSTGEPVNVFVFNREGRGGQVLPQSCGALCPAGSPVAAICPAAAVATLARPGDNVTALGSVNTAFGGVFYSPSSPIDEHGSVTIEPSASTALGSLAGSTRTDFLTGTVITGPHGYRGLPVIGFWARTFENGALNCNGATCQGNYGSAFPLTYKRIITP